MRNRPSLRAPLVGLALQRKAAPALAIAAFFEGVVALRRAEVERLRDLRAQRSRIAAQLVHNRRARRANDGRFLPVRPLEHELAAVNADIHAAV